MRVYEEPIEVRAGEVAGREAPALFLWRNRLWSVRSVETLWAVTEKEVWRVVAADGRNGTRGLYELTQVRSTGAWRLSRVVD